MVTSIIHCIDFNCDVRVTLQAQLSYHFRDYRIEIAAGETEAIAQLLPASDYFSLPDGGDTS